MKNRKQLLADFYLELLAIPATDQFRIKNISLYIHICRSLAVELDSDYNTVENIFKRMAAEDR